MEWKTISELPKYQVSNEGEVRSLYFNKIKLMKPICVHGYYYVNLHYAPGKSRRYAIHRLVASAFIPNPENKPAVDHIDCDKSNNKVTNLRWVTYSENSMNPITRERAKQGLIGHYAGLGRCGSKHPLSKAIERIDINGNIVSYECIEQECREGFTKTAISGCCHGKTKIYRGFIWRFKDDERKNDINLEKEIAKRDWPVWKMDVNGTITYYKNVSLALKEGYTKKQIYQACKNILLHKKQYKNCVHWSFSPFNR